MAKTSHFASERLRASRGCRAASQGARSRFWKFSDLTPVEAAVSAIGSSRPVASRCDFLNAEIAESPEHFKWKIIADYGRYRKVKPNGVLEVAFQFNPAQPHVTLSGLPLRLPRIKSIRRDKDVDPIDTLVTCA